MNDLVHQNEPINGLQSDKLDDSVYFHGLEKMSSPYKKWGTYLHFISVSIGTFVFSSSSSFFSCSYFSSNRKFIKYISIERILKDFCTSFHSNFLRSNVANTTPTTTTYVLHDVTQTTEIGVVTNCCVPTSFVWIYRYWLQHIVLDQKWNRVIISSQLDSCGYGRYQNFEGKTTVKLGPRMYNNPIL